MSYLSQALERRNVQPLDAYQGAWLSKTATEKVDLTEPLKPGIYQGTRRIGDYTHSIKVPFASHRFIVMVPKDPEKFEGKLTDLGNGQKGIIVGAYNKDPLPGTKERRLKYHRNHGNDLIAVRELMKLKSPGAGAWGAKIKRVFRNAGDGPDDEIQRILETARAYREATKDKPVRYPSNVENIFATGKNSNTFVASLLAYSGFKNKAIRDMPGYDAGARLRLDPALFGKETDK